MKRTVMVAGALIGVLATYSLVVRRWHLRWGATDGEVLEATEAWALWTERRWGEYLTVAATAGFLPLELIELTHSVTPTKVVALAINLAIVVWLILAKHLFGVRGGEAALHDSVDWATILASPTPAGSRGTSRRG